MSQPLASLIAQAIATTLGTVVRVANGYNFDLLPAQVMDVKKDLETEAGVYPAVSIYSTGFENRQQGDEASFSQVLQTIHFHIDGAVMIQTDWEAETWNLLSDLERAVTKDISQGVGAKNTYVTGGTKWGWSASGAAFVTLSFDVLLRHAVNDPSAEYQTTYN